MKASAKLSTNSLRKLSNHTMTKTPEDIIRESEALRKKLAKIGRSHSNRSFLPKTHRHSEGQLAFEQTFSQRDLVTVSIRMNSVIDPRRPRQKVGRVGLAVEGEQRSKQGFFGSGAADSRKDSSHLVHLIPLKFTSAPLMAFRVPALPAVRTWGTHLRLLEPWPIA